MTDYKYVPFEYNLGACQTYKHANNTRLEVVSNDKKHTNMQTIPDSHPELAKHRCVSLILGGLEVVFNDRT